MTIAHCITSAKEFMSYSVSIIILTGITNIHGRGKINDFSNYKKNIELLKLARSLKKFNPAELMLLKIARS